MLQYVRRALLPVFLLFAACGGDDGAKSESSGYGGADMAVAEEGLAVGAAQRFAPPEAPRADADAAATPAQGRPRMVIRTGHATVEVDDLDTSVDAVGALAERAGGYLSNVALSGGRDQVRSATLTLRIPAARFDETLAALDSLGEVESVHIDSQDVGEQYADLEVRIANARRLEERLLELLETRTGSLEDVLAVERELARVRVEIESMDAQMRSMRDRVDMSSLGVMLHEPEPLFSSGGGDNMLVRAMRQAGRNFVGFVGGFIASLGVLVPLAVLLGVVWLLWRRWRHRRRARD